jgi:hypothetical protein
LAGECAKQAGLSIEVYPADWKKHGRSAGPIRNQHMLDVGKPNLVIAFPGGRGTADMMKRAEKAGIEVRRIEVCEDCPPGETKPAVRQCWDCRALVCNPCSQAHGPKAWPCCGRCNHANTDGGTRGREKSPNDF